MELRHLRYFVALADELHFGRAADRLHLTQPGLSSQIRAFERELGVPLFDRNRRRVEVTEAGRALWPEAVELLARADAAVELVRQVGAGRRGRLVVSLTRTASSGPAAELVDSFRDRYPAVDMELTSGYTGLHEARLADREIDVGFVRPPVADADLTVVPVHEEQILLAVRRDDPLAKRRRVRRADIVDRPLVWWPREHGPGMWDRMLDQVYGTGTRPTPARWEPEEERMLAAVAAGHGITLVPEGRGRQLCPSAVVLRRFAVPTPTVPVAVAWRTDNQNPAVGLFAEHVRRSVVQDR